MSDNHGYFKPLSRFVAVDTNNANRFLINNEWTFQIPNGFIYAIDSEIGEGGTLSGGFDLAGSKKPMVVKGLKNETSYLFNFGLQKHFDITGQYFSVEDCKYDNRADGGSDAYQQAIIVDESDLFVDIILENIWPLGYSFKIRVRGTNIDPFDFLSMPGNVNHSVMDSIVESMTDIAFSICLKDSPVSKEDRKNSFKNRTNGSKSNTTAEGSSGGEFIVSNGMLQKYIGSSVDVVIPKGVTKIADNTFSGKSIRSVVIPEGVTEIGRRAFENCFKLETVSLPSTICGIGGYCFVDCHKLKSIDLGNKLTAIEDSVFSECFELENVVIPSGVKYIDAFAFKNCRKLTGIVLPDGVESIGFQAFAYCDNLSYLYVPARVTEFRESLIGTAPFDGSKNLVVHTPAGSAAETYCKSRGIKYVTDDKPIDVTVVKTNISNHTSAFAYAEPDWSDDETDQETTYTNEELALYQSKQCGVSEDFSRQYVIRKEDDGLTIVSINNKDATSVVLPEGLGIIGIGEYAFVTCKSLTDIKIPEGVRRIGNNAFYGCESLKTVVLPESIRSIGESAFTDCIALTDITLPEGIESIGDGAFDSCEKLEIISIPKKLDSISNNAFYGCKSVKKLFIPDNIKSIGNHAFSACDSLESVTVSKSVESIGEKAFSCCTSLQNVTILNPQTVIEKDAFSFRVKVDCPFGSKAEKYCKANKIRYECNDAPETVVDLTSFKKVFKFKEENGAITITGLKDQYLKNVVFPPELNITVIGKRAFDSAKIEEVVIPDSVIVIEAEAFSFCRDLKKIELGKNVKSIGKEAFKACHSLKELRCNDGLEYIGDYAFSDSEIEQVFLSKSVTLGDRPFPKTSVKVITVDKENPVYHSIDNCVIKTATKELVFGCGTSVIPSDGSVEIISTGAYSGCLGVIDIKIPEGVKIIGDFSFASCKGLRSLILPESLTQIGKNAFALCESLTSATIPKSVKKISPNAFMDCDKLTVHTPAGSAADSYCRKNGIAVVNDL